MVGQIVKNIVACEMSLDIGSAYLCHCEATSVGHTPWSELATGVLLSMLKLPKEWNTPGKHLGLLRGVIRSNPSKSPLPR